MRRPISPCQKNFEEPMSQLLMWIKNLAIRWPRRDEAFVWYNPISRI